jgi:tripartite-type tricarboxylate transporter receptor subunit TctC
VSAPRRLANLPDVPTFTELGLPRLVAHNWFGLSAPSGTPPAIVMRLSRALNEALATPVLAGKLAIVGFDIVPMDPTAFTAFVGVNLLQSALTKWCLMETIVRKLGARTGA